MGSCASVLDSSATLFVEHGEETPQDIIIGVVEAARREIKESSLAKHTPTEGPNWRTVVHAASSCETAKDLNGKCIDLRIDELWVLAPLAYCTESDKGDKVVLHTLKSVPALRDRVLTMGEPFVLWRARKPSDESGLWTVRYAGAERVELTAAGSSAAAVNIVESGARVTEGRRFAPEMHSASVTDAQVLAHARAVLRRYRNFYGVCDMNSKSGAGKHPINAMA